MRFAISRATRAPTTRPNPQFSQLAKAETQNSRTAARACPAGMAAIRYNKRRTGAESARATPVDRISAICIAKARIPQMPSYQEVAIFAASADVQSQDAAAVMNVRISA